ncbi:MAG: hypothetical protein ABL914_10435 [Novosphingobium sp.]|uniref:hypothetical protein n=1 Tax=Novosphingobium sp. TaxID=1874826 RepID=UPI0032BCB90A
MNEAERRLGEDRAVRRSARGLFDRRLAQVKADYQARGVPDRIKAKAAAESRKALDTALDVAGESKGIIAGTVAVLLLWFLRNPLFDLARRILGSGPDEVQDRPASAEPEDQE